MDLSMVSATLLLLLVLDPFGNIPLFVAVLNTVEPRRRTAVVLRECAVAFAILFLFLFFGKHFLELLNLSETSLAIAVEMFLGGIEDFVRHLQSE